MESKKLLVTASPHLTDGSSTMGLMVHVIIALVPAWIASVLIFGLRALAVSAVTVIACVVFEALYNILMKKPQTIGDCSAVVTGIILAFNLPASIPLWIAVVGAFVAIVVTKQLFGGLGMNFANPALVGRIALFIGFAARMTNYTPPEGALDGMASATPLALAKTQSGIAMLKDLLLGTHPGMLGETCAVALILGGIYLIATKTISPAIPVSYLATVAVMCVLLGQDVVLHLLSGGLLLGAFFLGPLWGALAAGLGSCLADAFGGYMVYVPATFVIKFLMGLIVAVIFRSLREKRPMLGVVIGGIAAEILMVAGYFLFTALLLGMGWGALPEIPGNCVQGAFGVIAGAVLFAALRRVPYMKQHRI